MEHSNGPEAFESSITGNGPINILSTGVKKDQQGYGLICQLSQNEVVLDTLLE